jgi:hypothetical protein
MLLEEEVAQGEEVEVWLEGHFGFPHKPSPA